MAKLGLAMDLSYVFTPFITWFVTGAFKFIVNSIKTKSFAFSLIGYGGFPSNHAAIVSSLLFLVAFKEGVDHPSFGVALSLTFIVVLDAASLRKQIGKHAESINKLSYPTDNTLRERIGHTKIEIAFGLLAGLFIAYMVSYFFEYFLVP